MLQELNYGDNDLWHFIACQSYHTNRIKVKYQKRDKFRDASSIHRASGENRRCATLESLVVSTISHWYSSCCLHRFHYNWLLYTSLCCQKKWFLWSLQFGILRIQLMSRRGKNMVVVYFEYCKYHEHFLHVILSMIIIINIYNWVKRLKTNHMYETQYFGSNIQQFTLLHIISLPYERPM